MGHNVQISKPVRIAYLVSHYPAISHTFIEREILAMRREGAEVHTFTVHAAPIETQLTATSQQEAQRTKSLLGLSLATYFIAIVYLVGNHPRALVGALRMAWRSGAPNLRSKIWQHFYVIESAVLLRHLLELQVNRIHVHHANNAADIARITVAMGNAMGGKNSEPWRWSLGMHGSTEFFEPVFYDLAAKVKSASHVACISDDCRGELQRLVEPDHWHKMSIVRMGVDSTIYKPPSDRRANRPPGCIRILYVGRLVERKGIPELLAATKELVDTGRRVELRIVGSGPLAGEITDRIAALGLKQEAKMTGPVGQDRLPDYYHWADVFCLPSFAEGVPVVLMEAMATELPVISSNIAGIPELVSSREIGVLLEPGDTRRLAQSISDLADSPEVRAKIGINARKKILLDFQPSVNARRLIEALTSDSSPQGEPGCDRGV